MIRTDFLGYNLQNNDSTNLKNKNIHNFPNFINIK